MYILQSLKAIQDGKTRDTEKRGRKKKEQELNDDQQKYPYVRSIC
jgi:hypothetical protein